MKRSYVFEWYETKAAKYGKDPHIRTNIVLLGKPCGKTEIDAKKALNIFMSNFGNLRKNTIVKIKELDENNEQIGEDIIPSDAEDAIVPTKKVA